MGHAHSAFVDIDAMLQDATEAGKEAIKHTIADQWRPGGDVEGLYEWNWNGDFSKSGATVTFTITVYFTPLFPDETPVEAQIGAALDEALAPFDQGKPERPQTELSQRLNHILDVVFERLGPPYSHTPAWDEYPARCLLVFGVQKADSDGHWSMASSISHRDFVSKTDAEWVADYVAYIPTMFEERTGPQYLKDDSEDDCI